MSVDTTSWETPKTRSDWGNRGPNWTPMRSAFGYFRLIFYPRFVLYWQEPIHFPKFSPTWSICRSIEGICRAIVTSYDQLCGGRIGDEKNAAKFACLNPDNWGYFGKITDLSSIFFERGHHHLRVRQNAIGNRQSEPELSPDEIIFLVLPGPFRFPGSTWKGRLWGFLPWSVISLPFVMNNKTRDRSSGYKKKCTWSFHGINTVSFLSESPDKRNTQLLFFKKNQKFSKAVINTPGQTRQ